MPVMPSQLLPKPSGRESTPCIACMQTGKASKGGKCFPCKGTGWLPCCGEKVAMGCPPILQPHKPRRLI